MTDIQVVSPGAEVSGSVGIEPEQQGSVFVDTGQKLGNNQEMDDWTHPGDGERWEEDGDNGFFPFA